MSEDEVHQRGEPGPEGPVGPVGPRGERGHQGAAAAIAPLVDSVDGLRTAVESLVKRAEKSERRITGIVIAICIDLVFTGGFATLYYQQERTAAELADTKAEVLCPLYASWLGTYNPTTRSPGLDRNTYEDVFGQMRIQYEHLGCTTPLVPKPSPTPTPEPLPSK